MQGADLGNRLQQAQMQGMLQSAFGSQPTMQEQLLNQIINPDGDMLSNSGGLFGSGIDWLTDKFGSNPTQPTLPSFMDQPNAPYYSKAVPTSADQIDLSSFWTN